jgi:hypothetical protein
VKWLYIGYNILLVDYSSFEFVFDLYIDRNNSITEDYRVILKSWTFGSIVRYLSVQFNFVPQNILTVCVHCLLL